MPEINLSFIASQVLWSTFAIACLVGIVMQKSRFCTMGAITDILIMDEWTRMRQWIMAMGVAILGVGYLTASGQIDTAKDRKSTRLNSSHTDISRMPSSA